MTTGIAFGLLAFGYSSPQGEVVLQDFRAAWRFLIKSPLSTVLAVATLSVTVAICSIAVGVLDETFRRPLGVANSDRLVTVYNARASAPQFQVLSYPIT